MKSIAGCLIGPIGLLGACAVPETKVLAPYKLANGNIYQDVVSVGSNGKGSSSTVTTIRTYAIECGLSERQVNECASSYKPIAVSTGNQDGIVNVVFPAVVGGGAAIAASSLLVQKTINNNNISNSANNNISNNPSNNVTNNVDYSGTSGSGATTTSDARLKKNIEEVGALQNGIKLYSFNYVKRKGYESLDTNATFVGVMAQEVLNSEFSEAVVIDKNGFFAVDYKAVGVELQTLEQWQASQAALLN